MTNLISTRRPDHYDGPGSCFHRRLAVAVLSFPMHSTLCRVPRNAEHHRRSGLFRCGWRRRRSRQPGRLLQRCIACGASLLLICVCTARSQVYGAPAPSSLWTAWPQRALATSMRVQQRCELVAYFHCVVDTRYAHGAALEQGRSGSSSLWYALHEATKLHCPLRYLDIVPRRRRSRRPCGSGSRTSFRQVRRQATENLLYDDKQVCPQVARSM